MYRDATLQAQNDQVSMRVLALYRAGELSGEVAQQLLPRPLETYEQPKRNDEQALKRLKKLPSELSATSVRRPID